MTTLSIISPVLNGVRTIQNNICSVRSQGYQSPDRLLEHVFVDGGSTDGSLDILRQNQGKGLKFVSGADQGLYDAMNKGITIARGDVIGILSADDVYADDYVVRSVLEVFDDPSVWSCYGDLLYVDRSNPGKVVRRWKTGPYDARMWYSGWMPPHPTFFVRRRIYEKFGLYRLDMGTSADYELMLRFLLKHGITTRYIPRVLVRMGTGGMSNVSLKNRVKANLMDRKAWKVNGLKPKPWTLWMKPLSKISQFNV